MSLYDIITNQDFNGRLPQLKRHNLRYTNILYIYYGGDLSAWSTGALGGNGNHTPPPGSRTSASPVKYLLTIYGNTTTKNIHYYSHPLTLQTTPSTKVQLSTKKRSEQATILRGQNQVGAISCTSQNNLHYYYSPCTLHCNTLESLSPLAPTKTFGTSQGVGIGYVECWNDLWLRTHPISVPNNITYKETKVHLLWHSVCCCPCPLAS